MSRCISLRPNKLLCPALPSSFNSPNLLPMSMSFVLSSIVKGRIFRYCSAPVSCHHLKMSRERFKSMESQLKHMACWQQTKTLPTSSASSAKPLRAWSRDDWLAFRFSSMNRRISLKESCYSYTSLASSKTLSMGRLRIVNSKQAMLKGTKTC